MLKSRNRIGVLPGLSDRESPAVCRGKCEEQEE